MNLRELLLFGVAGWTGLGVIGTVIALRRQERAKARRGALWVACIWAVYLAVLLGVSLTQPQRVVAVGQEQCFHEMCFTVTGVEELPGYLIRNGDRLVRVSVRVRNQAQRGSSSEGSIRTYLVDAQGRRWDESLGINGVQLTTRVPAGESVVSEPIFRVPANATGLGLVFTLGWKQPGVLAIGDSDSLMHRRTVVKLDR